MMGTAIGYLGIVLGFFVAPVQLIRIIRTREVTGISLATYIFLCLALICYLLHAFYIKSPVFILAQSLNIITNMGVLFLLFRYRK